MNSKSAVVGESVAAVRARWVEALRSGRYAQGQRLLRSLDGQYCCLGVLCDIAGAQWTEAGDDDAYMPEGNDFLVGYISSRWMAAAGLADHEARALYSMNDGMGDYDRPHSFAEIADYIESLPLPTTEEVA